MLKSTRVPGTGTNFMPRLFSHGYSLVAPLLGGAEGVCEWTDARPKMKTAVPKFPTARFDRKRDLNAIFTLRGFMNSSAYTRKSKSRSAAALPTDAAHEASTVFQRCLLVLLWFWQRTQC